MPTLTNSEYVAKFSVNPELRTIYLFGDICEETSEHAVKWLGEFGKSDGEITLVINSGGGDVVDGLAIMDAIELCNVPVIGIATGSCMSMAVLVLSVCDSRKATKSTSFLIHSGQQSLEGTPEQNAARIQHYTAVDIDCNTRLAKLMKKTLKQYNKIFVGEIYFNAEKALKLGLIDAICTRSE